MVPLGTQTDASFPQSSASAALELDHGRVVAEDVVPTAASAMARRMAGVGRVTVVSSSDPTTSLTAAFLTLWGRTDHGSVCERRIRRPRSVAPPLTPA